MCSGARSAISEIAEAIDQLAADSRARNARHGGGSAGGAPAPDVAPDMTADMAARVAAIWAMVAALDPEVDRLRVGYESG